MNLPASTTSPDTSSAPPPRTTPPHRKLFIKNWKIGRKLTIGFGILVLLTLGVVGLTYFTSNGAITTINSTVDVRVPVALASSRSQADLLRMFGNVRGYLALGDPRFLTSYEQSEQAFREDLALLEELSKGQGFASENKHRLEELRANFAEWEGLPDKLFLLRDDQMEREPAYAWLNTSGASLGGSILININDLIQMQTERAPSFANNAVIEDMARFQSSFAAMFSGLRGYVTTLNPNFRYYEYRTNLQVNTEAWENIVRQRDNLTPEQQVLLDEIEAAREQFLDEVPGKVFDVMSSDQWREDLYLFQTEIEPLTNRMNTLLVEITQVQQQAMLRDLRWGSQALITSQWQTIIGGIIAVFAGFLLALVFQMNIAGPVRRLTEVATSIRKGNLNALAPVESGDEIGVFAETFNDMTAQLRETMLQIRKEKKRADDLLNIVIPIGVALTSERDFNRLLGNMLVEAMSFCHADGGILFLREGNDLKLVMIINNSQQVSLGGTSTMPVPMQHIELQSDSGESTDTRDNVIAHAAITGASVNIQNSYQDERFTFAGLRDFDQQYSYRSVSILAIPLKNNRDEVLGVLTLLNAQDPETNEIIPFDENLQQMMESFSSLAVAALESYIREQSLRQEIKQLRIEIDESKRQQQVSEIVDTDFFQDLRAKARTLRERNKGTASQGSEEAAEEA